MAIFWVATVIPLVSLFLLSFTQGDTSLYSNFGDQLSSGESTVIDSSNAQSYFGGIIAISIGLLTLGGIFLLMLERRWGRAAFEN